MSLGLLRSGWAEEPELELEPGSGVVFSLAFRLFGFPPRLSAALPFPQVFS